MQEKILAKLRELRAEDDLAAMEFAAGRSEAMMKAYCNIDELPEELLGAGVALAGLLLDSGGAVTPSQKTKSIKEGDVSITFQEDGHGAEEEKLLACFKVELDRWKRMNW